jgi:alkylated DNA nucleotide flippase Atl1
VEPVIYAADIGSIASGNFGWARLDPGQGTPQVERNDGTEIAELVDAVAHDLDVEERGVALGFECPLFVPVPEDPFLLGTARFGEGNRPFSGGPGTGALVTGLVQTAWILRSLRERCPEAVTFLDWDEFTGAGRGLYLWEAFVTGKAKGAAHVDDALIAANTFRDALPNPPAANAVEAERPLSLIGSAVLWSGWSTELALLHKPCLVLKSVSADAVDHPVAKANHAVVSRSSHPTDSLHERVSRIAEQIPLGTWSTYGDIAKMIDAIAIAVGGVVGAGGIPNEHRILNAKRKFPEGAPASHVEKLKVEGVRFVNGRADPRQRWQPDSL